MRAVAGDRSAQQSDLAGGRRREPQEEAHQGRLSGAVRSQEAEGGAAGNDEAHPVDRDAMAEALGHLGRFDGTRIAAHADVSDCGVAVAHGRAFAHMRRPGSHQFHSPRSFMDAGSRTALTMVASIRIAEARPTPACLTSNWLRVPKIANTPTMTSAALVTTPAVRVTPYVTASSVVMPASTASRIRL